MASLGLADFERAAPIIFRQEIRNRLFNMGFHREVVHVECYRELMSRRVCVEVRVNRPDDSGLLKARACVPEEMMADVDVEQLYRILIDGIFERLVQLIEEDGENRIQVKGKAQRRTLALPDADRNAKVWTFAKADPRRNGIRKIRFREK